jgi:putative flippase GtrA
VIGFACSITLHFTLQRAFVWVGHEEFALEFRHQAGRYLLMAAAQYGVTAASTYWLPHALGIATEIVYLITFAIVTATGFVVMRLIIFHGDEPLLGETLDAGYRSNTPTTSDDPSA